MQDRTQQPSVKQHTAGLLRGLLIIAVAFAVTACSGALPLVYNRLDSMVGFYFEGLISLDEQQAAALEQTLSRNLAWHRESELDRYAEFLRGMAASMSAGLDRGQLLAAGLRAEEYWRDVFEQAAPGYTALARGLSDAQVDELLESLAEQDEKSWRKHAKRDAGQRQAQRERRLRRAIERLVGPLKDGQRELLRTYVANNPSIMEQWRDNRRAWRQALAAVLAERRNAPDFEARMYQLIARPDELWTPAYRLAVEQGREGFADMLIELDATLTSGQRAAAEQWLLALADDLEGLSGKDG